MNDTHAALLWALAIVSGIAIAAVTASAVLWRELREVKRLCMTAWIRLDAAMQARAEDRRERDKLVRYAARAATVIEGLRAIATEAAMLAQLDALRADSCWAPLHDEPEGAPA